MNAVLFTSWGRHRITFQPISRLEDAFWKVNVRLAVFIYSHAVESMSERAHISWLSCHTNYYAIAVPLLLRWFGIKEMANSRNQVEKKSIHIWYGYGYGNKNEIYSLLLLCLFWMTHILRWRTLKVVESLWLCVISEHVMDFHFHANLQLLKCCFDMHSAQWRACALWVRVCHSTTTTTTDHS